MYTTYILKSLKTQRYYVGSTSDIKKRLLLHNGGKVMSTKSFIPWIIVYQEKFATLAQARKRELQIKSWKKRANIEKLIEASSSNG